LARVAERGSQRLDAGRRLAVVVAEQDVEGGRGERREPEPGRERANESGSTHWMSS
jgi:hypothetical protein